jgi:FkbM family methyltransferase
MLGFWESETFSLLDRVFSNPSLIDQSSVICDIGANIGYYSLWFAKKLSSRAEIFAFEPAANILPMLRKNLALNGGRMIEVVEQACSDASGVVEFFISDHHHCSSLNQDWARNGGPDEPVQVTVRSTTLDDFFAARGRTGPDFIKMDIEGGGVFALRGADTCFSRKRPLALIESHTPAEDAAISAVMLTHEYQAFRLNDRRWVVERGETHPNPVGVWGTLLLCPTETRRQVEALV